MGFLRAVKSFFGTSGDTSRRVYVVDGTRLANEKSGRRLAPREQLEMIRALARVAKTEGMELHVLFDSDRPLREVEDGGDYQGVTVHFADGAESLLAKALKQCRGQGTLVSAGEAAEKAAADAGVTIVSSGTFRKAFLAAGGGDTGDRRRGKDRRRGRSGGRPPQRGRNGNEAEAPAPAAAPASEEQNVVHSLIDLVE